MQKNAGARILLVTAADRTIAEEVAKFVGLFDEVLATDGGMNLKGRGKKDLLVERFGHGGFDYIGNSISDLSVFRAARRKFRAGQVWMLRARMAISSDVEVVSLETPDESNLARVHELVRSLRPKQWLKNVLVLLPIILAHQLHLWRIIPVLVTMAAFCLAASSGYLVNDLLDLKSDRLHPRKRYRPLASGALPVVAGIHSTVILAIAAGLLAASVNRSVLIATAGYYLSTILYSTYLKRVVLLDTMALAGLYTLRIIAGGYAGEVKISFWLGAFSMFLFISLALVKRYSELIRTSADKVEPNSRRDYLSADIPQLLALGVGSAMVASLVMALYLNSPDVTVLYRNPQWLWAVCVAITYWAGRMWILAGRGIVDDDPLLFAARDGVSLTIGVLCALILLVAR
jgi:4-hydroxybenzoate polyprenyltransferase